MKATGIVRRIDDLGRVVIPKEIRRTLRIREGDPLEIFTDREGEIILKKYSPIGELSLFSRQYADSLAQVTGALVCICDMDQIVAAAGNGRKEFQEKYISKTLGQLLDERRDVLFTKEDKNFVFITGQEDDSAQEVICPILCEGDVIGGVVILARDEKRRMGETELKLASCAAAFLGRQMEQ